MTKRNSAYFVAGILALAMICTPSQQAAGSSQRHSDRDDWFSSMPEKEQETIRKSFSMNAASSRRTLEVDNVFGSIEVTGGSSNEVQLVVVKTTRAESKAKLEEARKKVTLDISQGGDALKFYVNGPFRCQCRNCGRCECGDCVSWNDDNGYNVRMDFELQIPRNIEITLKTVNSGHIRVRNVTGNYVVRNVNGDIEMQDIAGSGKVSTVNGPVKVSFRENPAESSVFSTINGNVELRFQRNLSADFRFKTFNGGIYSDFPVTSLPVHAIQEERRGGKVIFRADRFTGGRIGSGGPEIKLENLNGDIRILENHE